MYIFTLLVLMAGSVFADDFIEVFLRASPSIGGNELLLFSGKDINKILNTINSGVVVSDILKWPKDALIEGEYVIKYYMNGLILKEYYVSSSFGVYDPNKNIMIFCDVVNVLRSYFISYIVQSKVVINNNR